MRDVVSTDFKDLLFAEVNNKINLIKQELEGEDLIPTLFSEHFNQQIQSLDDVTYRDLARTAAQTIVQESCTELPLTTQLVEKLETRISAPVDRLRVLYSGLISIKQLLEAASNVSLTEECVLAVMKNGLYSGPDFSMKMCQVCGRETARFRPCVNTCKNVARDCLDRFRGVSSLINELATQLDRHRAMLTVDVEGVFEVVEEWRADQENSGYFQDCVISEGGLTFDLKQGASLVFSSNPLQLHDVFKQSADYACWRSEAVEGDCWTAKGVTVADSVQVLPYTTSNIPVTLSGQVDDVMRTALESLQNSIKVSEKVNRGESLLEPDSFTTNFMYTTDTRPVEQRSTSVQETRPPVSTGDIRTLVTSATPSVAGQVDNLESIKPDNTGDTKTAEKDPTTAEKAPTTTEKAPTTAEKDPTTMKQAVSREITTATVEELPQSTEQAKKSHATQNHVTKRQVTVEIEKEHVTNSTGLQVLTVQGDDDDGEHGLKEELDKDNTQDRVTPAVANVSISGRGNTSEDKASQEDPAVSDGSNERNINSNSEEDKTSVETTVLETEEVDQESVLPSEGSSNKSESTEKVAEKSISERQKSGPITEPVQSNTVDIKADSTTERKPREVDKPASEFRNQEGSTETDQHDQNISEEETNQTFPDVATPTNDQHVTTPKPTLAWDLEDDFKVPPDSSSLTVESKQMMSLVAICLGFFILTG